MILVLPILAIVLFFLALSLGQAIDETTDDQIKELITRIMMSILIVSLLLVFAGAVIILIWG